MTEPLLLRQLRLRLTQLGYRVFRNNVGVGWAGEKPVHVNKDTWMLVKAGSVVIRHARVLHAGLCVGSSDLIGFRSVTITPEMVGTQVAVFTAVEAKTGKVRVTPEQQAFLDAVRSAGGVAVVARSVEDLG